MDDQNSGIQFSQCIDPVIGEFLLLFWISKVSIKFCVFFNGKIEGKLVVSIRNNFFLFYLFEFFVRYKKCEQAKTHLSVMWELCSSY